MQEARGWIDMKAELDYGYRNIKCTASTFFLFQESLRCIIRKFAIYITKHDFFIRSDSFYFISNPIFCIFLIPIILMNYQESGYLLHVN